ncbi:GLPGLI family protein [Chryseobacterium sp. SNU WT5]|nr:GLPGLI family protein [Chryseobacterium sp. SNU WT5]
MITHSVYFLNCEMKKIVLIFCLLVFYKVTVAQNITFLYELSQKRDSDDNKYSTTPFYLDVMGKESVFRSEKDRYSDSLVEKTGFGIGSGLTFANQFYVKKNLSKMEIIKSITTPLMNYKYDLKISDTLDWQISPEKQRIGEIECQKAYLKYGGRSWVAWFSESIPLQDGPYIFNGLPGLIVKISDEQSNFVFNLVEVMSSKQKNIYI